MLGDSLEQLIQETDKASLAIVALLLKRFQETTAIVGPVGNIYTVFFHDLMINFTGTLIHRVAHEHYQDPTNFPKVNQRYALSPYPISSTDLETSIKEKTLRTKLREIPLSRAAIGEALPFGYRQDRLASKIFHILGCFKPFVLAYLPKKSEQIDWLIETVDEVCQLYEIPQRGIVRENWRRYVTHHITEKQSSLRERGVVLGTRNNLQNRKLAVNYMQQDKDVVAITHGEVANSVMNEPPFGYSERSLCTMLIDYGDYDKDGCYNRPLISPLQKLYRSAPIVGKLFHENDQIRRPDPSLCRSLYIPTTYSGNDLYGPFHIYEDAVYRKWQSLLFEAFPGLIMKTHPKSKSEPLPGLITEPRQLEECLTDYDLLVFDYFATGSMLAIMSDKPLIYFDIGLRRLAPEFSRDLKNRCEYAKIDLSTDIRVQCANTIEKLWSSNREWSNSKMACYSLCKDERFSWLELLKAVSTGSTRLL